MQVSYQQVAVAAEADTRAPHPLQVDVGAQRLHVPETALQRALLPEQRLQPESRKNNFQNSNHVGRIPGWFCPQFNEFYQTHPL